MRFAICALALSFPALFVFVHFVLIYGHYLHGAEPRITQEGKMRLYTTTETCGHQQILPETDERLWRDDPDLGTPLLCGDYTLAYEGLDEAAILAEARADAENPRLSYWQQAVAARVVRYLS